MSPCLRGLVLERPDAKHVQAERLRVVQNLIHPGQLVAPWLGGQRVDET